MHGCFIGSSSFKVIVCNCKLRKEIIRCGKFYLMGRVYAQVCLTCVEFITLLYSFHIRVLDTKDILEKV